MPVCKTLVIKHLPETLSHKDREEFLKYFGAKEVKFMSSKSNRYNIAFARFENENTAENVLHRLHQMSILGRCLSVEYAKNEGCTFQPKKNSESIMPKLKQNIEQHSEFLEKLSCWHSELNFKQPVPSHLKYQYPPPDRHILTNLIKALITVPKFYTQVLHLMNKMNLPCPFGKDILQDVDLSALSLLGNAKIENLEKGVGTVRKGETSSESELTSDEEFKCLKKSSNLQKRETLKKPKIRVPRVVKPETSIGSSKRKKVKFEDVFEPHLDDKESKKIKLNYNVAIPEQGLASSAVHEGDQGETNSGFGFLHPIKSVTLGDEVEDRRDEREEERLEKEEIVCITEAELSLNRIPEKDRSILPVFKNYAEGAPTCRLYIKNLAKTVSDADLRFIFSRYIPGNLTDEPNLFDIRLMQEGRMKGQAFVTLQSIELAQQALKETNGYILRDKPLVVQFARSSTNVK